MNRLLVQSVTVASIALFSISISTSTYAQQYPTKAIRFVVPFAAGGGADAFTRIVCQRLSANLGQQVVVDNRVGAGGNIGAALVAKSPADGYTLMLLLQPHTVNANLYTNLTFDIIRDFSPISLMGATPLILVTHPSLPVKTVKDLITLARSRPGDLLYASSGNGGSPHLAAHLFTSMASIKLLHIPYRGNSDATADLISGQTQIMFSPVNTVVPHIKTGRLRALGVTSAKRASTIPELPTLTEAGLPGYEVDVWYGAVAPAGTPRDLITRLHTELVKVIRMPDLRELVSSQGTELLTNTPDEFVVFLKAEIAKWGKVVKSSGMKIE